MSSLALAKCLLVLFVLLGLFSQFSAARPVAELEVRDVYVPPVLYPRIGTVWYKGHTYNVTWDTSKQPKQITNLQGRIVLRKGELTTPIILAQGFDIRIGHAEVTIPRLKDVKQGSDYSVVLFGDSGNWSPPFTIKE